MSHIAKIIKKNDYRKIIILRERKAVGPLWVRYESAILRNIKFYCERPQKKLMGLCRAVAADAFHNIFGLLWNKAFRQGDGRDGDIVEAECFVTFDASKMYMAEAVAGVVVMADAVFLRTATVVDVVEQVCVAEKCQGSEQGAAVDGWQSLFKVVKAENTIETMTYLFPNHQSHRGDAYAGIM